MVVFHAVRAVVVELLGVLLVLWLLFGTASWTLECAGVSQETTSGLLASFRNPIVGPSKSDAGQESVSEDVAQRLDHYSRMYRRAATSYFRRLGDEFSTDVRKVQQTPRIDAYRLSLY